MESFFVDHSNIHENSRKEKHALDANFVGLAVPEFIITECYRIYDSMKIKPQVRRNNRRILIYFLLVNAYREIGMTYDENDIMKLVNIDGKDASRSWSMFSPTQTGYRPKLEIATPKDLIPIMAEKFLPKDQVPIILEMSSLIGSKIHNFNRLIPRDMAAAVLLYYLKHNGYHTIDDSAFATIMNVKVTQMLYNYDLVLATNTSM